MLLLDMARNGCGDRTAVGDTSSGLTYDALFERCRAAGERFDRSSATTIGYACLTSEAYPIALFGAAWAGLPFAPLNYRLSAEQLGALGRRIAPALVLGNDVALQVFDRIEGIEKVMGEHLLEEPPAGALSLGEWEDDGETPAVTLFTSGTTGEPKAAILRHRHLVSYVLGSVEFMSADPDEAALVSVPPYHIAAVAAVLSSVYAGRRMVQLPAFDADAWIDLANHEHVTHAMVVPTMLDRIVTRLEERRTSVPSLRMLSYGGGKMARSTIERALELLPETGFVNAYGLTETSSTITLLDAADHRAAHRSSDEVHRRRLTSVGRPLPGIEISVRTTRGNPVDDDDRGEIWVRGEQVAGEYAERGSVLDAGGWFHTNDEGWIDSDGYLFVVGRLDDVIVRGGENISPGEIEAVLVSHPDVADAACIGAPDDEWGEVVVGAVVRTPGTAVTEPDLIGFVREELRSSKVPARIVFVDELIYNELGKLRRREVRDRIVPTQAPQTHTIRDS